jgi:hypothetical protein
VGSLRTLASQGEINRHGKISTLITLKEFLIPTGQITQDIVNKAEKLTTFILKNMENNKAYWQNGFFLFPLSDTFEDNIFHLTFLKLSQFSISGVVVPCGHETTVLLTMYIDKLFEPAYFEPYPVVSPDVCISEDRLI